MLPTTGELTEGERLLIYRLRRGETQAQRAKKIGTSFKKYKAAELGGARADPDWNVSLGRLQDFEACRIARRRAGLTLDQLARKIGISRWWLCLLEQGKGPVDRIRDYWTS